MMHSRRGCEAVEHRELVFFGAYDPGYPRNSIIRKGLIKCGYRVSECRADNRLKVHMRYPVLAWRSMAMRNPGRIVFVPDFRHKDVPLAWLLSRISGRSLVFDPLVSRYETRVLDRGDVPEGSLQAWHNRNIDRLSFKLPDLVLADTEAHAAFYTSQYALEAGKVEALHIGFDDDFFHEEPYSCGNGTLEVLFYGTYLPLHGVRTIIDAISLLADRPYHFTLVGEGQTYGEMRKRAAHIPSKSISFLPKVPAERLNAMIAGSDMVLGIFGVTRKAAMVIPNKVYQALAVGRPVITADTPAVREIFSKGEHLSTVPPGNPRALADAVLMLGESAELRGRIAAAGGSYVRREFNSKRVAERLVKMFQEKGIS
jgi:glycosyltransferase involved in cell wall biosynthesis